MRTFCLLALCSMPCLVSATEIVWSADRRLTWRDFEAPVARGAAPVNVASTTSSLRWTYEYEIEGTAAGCTYRTLDVRSSAVFEGAHSWVRPDHRTAHVLAHEQGHFDITQIFKLVFDAAARERIGATSRCEGKNARRASAAVENEAARTIGALYDRVWRAHMKAQQAYDAETEHGIRRREQERWLELIGAGLRGQRQAWAELGAPDAGD